MDVTQLALDKSKARELWQEYKAHRQIQTPMDREIERVYRLIAQGRVVIQALASITAAGLNEAGHPKLAIGRADEKSVRCSFHNNAVTFTGMIDRYHDARSQDRRFRVSMPGTRWDAPQQMAAVPLVPVHLRPKTALNGYSILWEAEWSKAPPVDPYLLRRIGGDMWLVVAAWDLTEVERAAMATRLQA